MMGGVKTPVLLLILVFGALQAVAVTDCPCGSLCGHKNACTEDPKDASPDDCCSQSRAASGQGTHGEESGRCLHVEPQTDLDVSVQGELFVPVLCWDIALVPPVERRAAEPAPRVVSPGPSPPAPGSPLFLQHSSLLL
jgi:hypothetical protein